MSENLKFALSILAVVIIGLGVICVLLTCAGEQYERRRKKDAEWLGDLIDRKTEVERELLIEYSPGGRKPWQK
jgi:hypothetical protein